MWVLKLAKLWYYQNVQGVVVKHQEPKRLLSNLSLRTPLSKVPILGDTLFWVQLHWEYKMNKIVKKCLLAGDKSMPKMHLKQPEFTYSPCVPFTKNKKKIKKLKKQEIQTIFTKTNLIRLVFNMI